MMSSESYTYDVFDIIHTILYVCIYERMYHSISVYDSINQN